MTTADILKIILNLFEAAAAFTGIYYWKKWRGTYWRWFILLLVFILCTELAAKAMHAYIPLRPYNKFLYRYLNIPVCFLFYLWLFRNYFANKKQEKWTWLFIGLYIIAWLMEEFLLPDYYKKYGSLSYQVGVIGILICGVFYVRELIKEDRILGFKTEIMFWVAGGLIIYHTITLPLNAMRNVIWQNTPNLFWAYWYLSFLFNYIMYTFFILGLRWGRQK